MSSMGGGSINDRGSLAHQDIVFNLRMLLGRLLAELSVRAAQAMRLRIGDRVRYPDVVIFSGPLDQTTRTLTDALAIFEVLLVDPGPPRLTPKAL